MPFELEMDILRAKAKQSIAKYGTHLVEIVNECGEAKSPRLCDRVVQRNRDLCLWPLSIY